MLKGLPVKGDLGFCSKGTRLIDAQKTYTSQKKETWDSAQKTLID
jgi:hypothetical protein